MRLAQLRLAQSKARVHPHLPPSILPLLRTSSPPHPPSPPTPSFGENHIPNKARRLLNRKARDNTATHVLVKAVADHGSGAVTDHGEYM